MSYRIFVHQLTSLVKLRCINQTLGDYQRNDITKFQCFLDEKREDVAGFCILYRLFVEFEQDLILDLHVWRIANNDVVSLGESLQ